MSKAFMPNLNTVKREMLTRSLAGIIMIAFDGKTYNIVSYGSTKKRRAQLCAMADGIAGDVEANNYCLDQFKEVRE